MKKSTRIVIEVLGPPFLGAVLPFAGSWKQFAAGEFSPLPILAYLACAYLFAIVPSLVYSLLMEAWLEKASPGPLGKISTVAMSTFLGFFAGTVLGLFFGLAAFLVIGALVGYILGMILAFAAGDDAEPDAA